MATDIAIAFLHCLSGEKQTRTLKQEPGQKKILWGITFLIYFMRKYSYYVRNSTDYGV